MVSGYVADMTVSSSRNFYLPSGGLQGQKPRIVSKLPYVKNPKKPIYCESGRMKRPRDEDQVSSTTVSFPKRFARENKRGMSNWGSVRSEIQWQQPPLIRPQFGPPAQFPLPQGPMNNTSTPSNFRSPFPKNNLNRGIDQNNRTSSDYPNKIVVGSACVEDMKTITIDGVSRYIRYYDDVAVIFMNWDDPREIFFQDGTRRVVVDDTYIYTLNFNEPFRECRIGKNIYQVKLGGPGREININNKPYECYFGSPGITIDLDGKITTIKLDGPPPQVKIGGSKSDLVAGNIELIIDAETIVPIFLDSKVQSFTFNGEKHTVKLCRGLKGVLINDEHFDVQFGGPPKPVMLKNKRHYIRFSVLPKGLKPGQIEIIGLKSEDISSSPITEDNRDIYEPVLPVPKRKSYHENKSPDNSNPTILQKNVIQQLDNHNVNLLTNAVSLLDRKKNSSSYQVKKQLSMQSLENTTYSCNESNIDLFQRLIASGLLSTTGSLPTEGSQPASCQNEENPTVCNKQLKKNQLLELVSFSNPESLKVRHAALYERLYSGTQCSNCGMRFPTEQSTQYREHLDWHFRQNHKRNKNAKFTFKRRWNYSMSDWLKYKETENPEEREKSYFELQQEAACAARRSATTAELPCARANPEQLGKVNCEVCGDKLEIFFNDDEEEWQLKNSVRFEDAFYHPICFEEYQQSLEKAALEDSNAEYQENNESDEIPETERVDDEDMEKKGEVLEVYLDRSDKSEKKKHEIPGNDDDVIIIEEPIEQIILDDDDDEPVVEQPPLSLDTFNLPRSPKINNLAEIIDDGFVDVESEFMILKNEDSIDETTFETLAAEKKDTSVEMRDEPKEKEQTASFVPSLDGELRMKAPSHATSVSGKIKINIHKPLSTNTSRYVKKKMFSDSDTLPEGVIDASQPLPPGEELIPLKLKPALQGIQLKKMPTVHTDSELTGICAIM